MTATAPPGDTQVVIYGEDVERMNRQLDAFLNLSSAKAVLLVDRTGRVVTRRGQDLRVDFETFGVLAAGSFAATRELARLVGEDQFSCLTHQGARHHIHLARVDDRTLFVVLFDERTTLGMVRLYAGETARRLVTLLEETRTRRRSPPEELDAGFGTSAKGAVDKLLGG